MFPNAAIASVALEGYRVSFFESRRVGGNASRRIDTRPTRSLCYSALGRERGSWR